MCACVYARMCLCTRVRKKTTTKKPDWFIATWQTPAHFSKSISAPEGNLHGTIYETEFTISVQLLGPTEETAADMNLLEQRHLVVSRCCVCVCVVCDVGSVHLAGSRRLFDVAVLPLRERV